MASYPSSVVVFTDKETGDTIEATHINALQDEVVALEEALIGGTGNFQSSNSTLAALQVTGGTTLAGRLQSSNSTLATLSVTGGSTLGTLQATNSTVSNLSVSSNSTITGGLTVTGGSTLGTLQATNSTLSNLSVSSNSTIAGALTVSGGSTLGTLQATNSTVSNLSVSSNSTIAGNLWVTGTIGVGTTAAVASVEVEREGSAILGSSLNIWVTGGGALNQLAQIGVGYKGVPTGVSPAVIAWRANSNNAFEGDLLFAVANRADYITAPTAALTIKDTGDVELVAALQVSGGSTLGTLQATNSTVSNLQVSSNSTIAGGLVVSGGSTLGTLQAGASTLASLSVSGGSTLASLVVTGAAGIGTADPGQKLEVAGSILSGIHDGAIAALYLNRWSSGDPFAVIRAGDVDRDVGVGFLFQRRDSAGILQDSLVIDSAGKVGIGVLSPGAKLAINGGLHVGSTSDPGDNNAAIDGALSVAGASTLGTLQAGASTLASLVVSGGSTLTTLQATNSTLSNLQVSSNSTIAGGLVVSGGSTLTTLQATNSTLSNLQVSSNSTIAGAFNVVGASTFSRATVTSALVVTGNSTLGILQAGNSTLSNLQVSSNSTIVGGLVVSGGSTLGTLQAGNSTLVALVVSGGSTLTTLQATNSTLSNLQVSSNSTIAGGLVVSGGSTLGTVQAGASTLASLVVSGGSTLTTLQATNSTLSNLQVSSNSTIAGTLQVSGQSTFSTNVLFRGQSPWIDVTAYGAVGDGTTDNSTAFAAASSAVSTQGAIIFVPPGTYAFSTTWVLKSSQVVTILGAGVDITELRFDSTNCDGISWISGQPYGKRAPIQIRDLTVSASTRNSGSALKLTQSSWASINEATVVLDNVLIRPDPPTGSGRAWHRGLDVTNAWNMYVSKLTVHGDNNDYMLSSRAISIGRRSIGVYLNQVVIYNCETGISIDDECEGQQYNQLQLVGVDVGIHWPASSQVWEFQLLNSHINAHREGIELQNVMSGAIIGNTISHMDTSTQVWTGIKLWSARFLNIQGNYFYSASSQTEYTQGITSSAVNTGMNQISQNVFNSIDQCVWLSSASSGCAVIGNIRAGGSTTVQNDGGSSNIVANNTP